MLKPRKSEPKDLTRLPRLPGLVLEGGKRLLGVNLPQDKEPVQPQFAMWVDVGQEFVRALAFIAPGASRDNGLTETLAALQTAFTGPFMPAPTGIDVRPGLPQTVRVDDEELAAAARTLLQPLGIKVEYRSELPVFEELFTEMSEELGANENDAPPEPFEWDLDRGQVTALYRAADAYAKQAPWNYMPDNPPLEIRLGEHGPQPEVRTIYASILGGAGMVEGVAFYNSLADYYNLVEAGYQQDEADDDEEDDVDVEQDLAMLRQMGAPVDQLPREEVLALLADLREADKGGSLLPALKDCLTFWLDKADELDPTYLEWLAGHGLKYTKRQRVPIFNRILAGGQTRNPDAREATALRLAIEGLAQFFQKHAKQLKTGLLPVEGLRLSARSADGAAIEIKYPASNYDQAHFEELARQGAASGKAFNIYELVFDHASDDLLEDKSERYQEQLLDLFARSPEGRSLSKPELEGGGWIDPVLQLGINYLGVTPAQIAPAQFRELLFEIFPQKITVPADEAPEIVRQLKLFWQFLEREFGLPNAPGCLKILDDTAAEQLEEELEDPANFGFAKSIMMEGLVRGFDLSSAAGIDEWMRTYTAEKGSLLGGPGRPQPLPAPEKSKTKANSRKPGPKKRR